MQEKKNAIARVSYNVLPCAFDKAEDVDYTPMLAIAADLMSVDASQKEKARKGIIQGTVAIVNGKGKAIGCAVLLDSLLNLKGCAIESQARSFASRCGIKYQQDDTGKYVVTGWMQIKDKDGNLVPTENLEAYLLNNIAWKKPSNGKNDKDEAPKAIANNGAGLMMFVQEKKGYILKQLKGRNDGNVKALFEKMAEDEVFCNKVLSLLSDYTADKGFFSKIFG